MMEPLGDRTELTELLSMDAFKPIQVGFKEPTDRAGEDRLRWAGARAKGLSYASG